LSCLAIIIIPLFSRDQADLSRFHDYKEIKAELDSLAELYPNLALVDSIGFSTNDHLPIWAIKLSANVANEEDEPALLFVGSIHAEEVMGNELVMDNIKEILTHYQISPYSGWLANLEMWFIPVLNPEGLAVVHGYTTENEEWIQDESYRKNKTDCNNNGIFDYVWGMGNDIDGIDLNRNMPFNWCHGDTLLQPDNSGIVENYDYYRGSSPLSEKETQALDNLFKEQKFVFSIIWHSARSGVDICESLYYPFNWLGYRPSPDLDIAGNIGSGIAGQIIKEQGGSTYEYAPSYTRRGSTPDYFYQQYGCLQFLIEAGTTNIHPYEPDITEQIQRTKLGVHWLLNRTMPFMSGNLNVHSMLTGHITDAATGSPLVAEIIIEENTADYLEPRLSEPVYGRFWRPLLTGPYTLTIKKRGYSTQTWYPILVSEGNWTNVSIELEPLEEYSYSGIVTDSNSNSLNAMLVVEDVETDTFYTENGEFSTTVYGTETKISVFAEGYFPYTVVTNPQSDQILRIELSQENIIFEDTFTNLTLWNVVGPWEIIEDLSVSGSAVTDSWAGWGFYERECNIHLTTSDPIDLITDNQLCLTFWSHLQTESHYDTCRVEISADNNNWQTIWSKTGYHYYWQQEFVPLDNYTGQGIYLRFRLNDHSPYVQGHEDDLVDPGWTIDNLKVISGYSNVVAISDEDITPATDIILKQNYPNPFNPVTTFVFTLPAEKINQASFRIYDVKGRKIDEIKLNQDEIKAGKVQWNAEDFASGIYFYSLIIDGKQKAVKKTVLMK